MAIIGNSDLTIVLDKLARFAGESASDPELSGSFVGGMSYASDNVFSGAGALCQFILDIGEVDVAADLLSAARDLDESHPTPSSGFISNIASIQAMIAALNTHIVRYSDQTSIDTYLTFLNTGTPVLRAHGHFRRYLGNVSARNSFIPNDLVLATFTCTGAATGTFASVATINKSSYGGAKLVVKNQSAVTTGATLSVTGKKWDASSSVITAAVGTGTDDFETDLSDTDKLFTEVTNVTISGGTGGNVYEIVAKTDRDISAA